LKSTVDGAAVSLVAAAVVAVVSAVVAAVVAAVLPVVAAAAAEVVGAAVELDELLSLPHAAATRESESVPAITSRRRAVFT
jgi:hypothetical protein